MCANYCYVASHACTYKHDIHTHLNLDYVLVQNFPVYAKHF